MKAIVLTGGKRAYSLQNVPIPKVTPNGVVVRVRATGICGTDIEIIDGVMQFYKENKAKYPIIPGHEWAGEVVEVGSLVKGFKKGDHVVGETTVPCYACEKCSKSAYTVCEARVEIGVLNHNGGFANYLLYPDTRSLHKIDPKIPFASAAAVEPLGIAVAAVAASPLKAEDTVVILGDGPIGLYLLQVCKQKGVKSIVVVGGIDHRLKKAKELGAVATLNALNTPIAKTLEEVVKNLNHGNLANLVIEATGNPKAFDLALNIVEPAGHITLLGLFTEKGEVELAKIVTKSVTVKGVLSSHGAVWTETIKLIESGKVDPSKIITHTLPLEEFSTAVRILDQKLDNVVKVVIVQNDGAKL